METPRACLGAKRIAPAVEFMSFGTNDLTQMTYGFSRDDVGKFLPQYLEKKLVESDPFVSLDQRAVSMIHRTNTMFRTLFLKLLIEHGWPQIIHGDIMVLTWYALIYHGMFQIAHGKLWIHHRKLYVE